MYIQITTRCNMTCEHCSQRASERGSDMSLKTYKNAIELCKDYDDMVQLGGGEPTLHPKFWEFLGLGLSVGELWLATNGSNTETSLALCGMARRGVIGCALSMDHWHDPIDWDVVEAFQDGMKRSMRSNDNSGLYYTDQGYQAAKAGDGREIRDVSNNILKRGRAIDNECWHEDGCVCNTLTVKPNGDARGCGCPRATKLGNVNETVNIPDWWEYGECCKNQDEEVTV